MRMTGRAALRALALMLPGLLVLVAGTPCRGQMNAYGTAATVNGVGISNETLERNFQEYLREMNVNIAAVRNPERVSSMRREVLDLLIDQELAWQAAQKAGLIAAEAEVEEAVAGVRSKFRSDQAFTTKLSVEGYTGESYRTHMKRLVSARKYLERAAAEASEVGEEEIHAFYTANPDKFTQLEDAVREQVRSFLKGEKAREAVQAELKRLRSAAKIEVHLPL